MNSYQATRLLIATWIFIFCPPLGVYALSNVLSS